MQGQPITNRQVARYMHARDHGRTQQQAADFSGMSERTARSLEHGGRAIRGPRSYRTRIDAFKDVWQEWVEPELRKTPPLQAITLFVDLQRRFPGRFPDGMRSAFERRVRGWRALHGPDRETFFPQEHPPGWQGILDFTVCDDLRLTIAGEALPHRLGHFRLSSSGWASAHVILGGESYPALAETLRIALERLGGVPQTLRTDSLSAAFKNLRQMNDLTERYSALCLHYGCSPTRNNRGEAHENGSIESPNGHLKRRLDQALILRGSRDFDDLPAYRQFVDDIVTNGNRNRLADFLIEQRILRPLPATAAVTWSEELGVVSRFSLIRVLHRSYMVPSRLNGHRLTVRLYDDRLEFFNRRQQVYLCPRLHLPGRTRHVNYHLIINRLVTKPGAFARLVYRDDLHPRPIFARTWINLRDRMSETEACKTYVRLLHLAHEHACEDILAQRLTTILEAGDLPQVEALRAELAKPRLVAVPAIVMPIPDPTAYDRLLSFRTG